jgi:hypothetical protein
MAPSTRSDDLHTPQSQGIKVISHSVDLRCFSTLVGVDGNQGHLEIQSRPSLRLHGLIQINIWVFLLLNVSGHLAHARSSNWQQSRNFVPCQRPNAVESADVAGSVIRWNLMNLLGVGKIYSNGDSLYSRDWRMEIVAQHFVLFIYIHSNCWSTFHSRATSYPSLCAYLIRGGQMIASTTHLLRSNAL